MSDGYTKIYGNRLRNSSLWLECWQARLVFVEMLAIADRHGVVNTPSVRVLANALNLSVADTEAGLAVLEAPDPDSRTDADEGRRLRRFQGGWSIVNYAHYREFRTEKQEADRLRAAEKRRAPKDPAVGDDARLVAKVADESRTTRLVALPAAEAASPSDLFSYSQISDAREAPATPTRKPRDEAKLLWSAALKAESEALGIPRPEVGGKIRDAVIRQAREWAGQRGEPFEAVLRAWVAGGLMAHVETGKEAHWALKDWRPYRPKGTPPRGAQGRQTRLQARPTTGADFEDEEDIQTQLARQGIGNG